MTSISEFSDSEFWTVCKTLEERYKRPVEPDKVDTELRLDPHSTVLTPCPALYWKVDDVNFVIVKVGDNRYRGQFFYRLYQMYGTGIEEFDDIATCAVTLLQVQTDHAAKEAEENNR